MTLLFCLQHTVKNIMKLTIWAERDWIVSVIWTKLERFMSGTEFCALNETIESQECFAQSQRNGKKQSQCYEWVNALWAEWNVTERSGAWMVDLSISRCSYSLEHHVIDYLSGTWLDRERDWNALWAERNFALWAKQSLWTKQSNHMNASLNLSGTEKSNPNAMIEWTLYKRNETWAERNGTEWSVNGKFVNFKMFLTVPTASQSCLQGY